mgnify:CR=1 FL=1
MSFNAKPPGEKTKITILVCTIWLLLLIPIIIVTALRDAAYAKIDTPEEEAALLIERARQLLSFFTGGMSNDLPRQESVPKDVADYVHLESVARKVNAACGTMIALHVVVVIPVVMSQLWKPVK